MRLKAKHCQTLELRDMSQLQHKHDCNIIFDIILRPCGPGDCSHTTSECSSRNHYQIVEDRMILSTGGHIGSRYNEPVTSWLQTIVNHRNIEKAEEELMSPVQREDLQHLTDVFINAVDTCTHQRVSLWNSLLTGFRTLS